MTVTLGGITLSDHLILEGIENAPDIAFSSQRTLGGKMILAMGPSLEGGRSLVMQAENHFLLSQITAVKALAKLGQTVTLVHHRGTFSVKILSVEVTPTEDFSNPGTDAWYSGTITMIEV
jgi:hypothetical protein